MHAGQPTHNRETPSQTTWSENGKQLVVPVQVIATLLNVGELQDARAVQLKPRVLAEVTDRSASAGGSRPPPPCTTHPVSVHTTATDNHEYLCEYLCMFVPFQVEP